MTTRNIILALVLLSSLAGFGSAVAESDSSAVMSADPQQATGLENLSIGGFNLPFSTRLVGFVVMWGITAAILGFSTHATYKIVSNRRKASRPKAVTAAPAKPQLAPGIVSSAQPAAKIHTGKETPAQPTAGPSQALPGAKAEAPRVQLPPAQPTSLLGGTNHASHTGELMAQAMAQATTAMAEATQAMAQAVTSLRPQEKRP